VCSSYGEGGAQKGRSKGRYHAQVDNGSIWLVNLIEAQRRSHIYRVDPRTNYHAFSVSRLDPQTNELSTPIKVPFMPEWMVAKEGSAWVLPNPTDNNGNDRVVRIDVKTQRVVETF
jgi:hypothetical protein